MSTGKKSDAIGCQENMSTSTKRSHRGKTALNILKEKHHKAKTANTNNIIEGSEDIPTL